MPTPLRVLLSSFSGFTPNQYPPRLAKWDPINSGGFIPSRTSQPKCVPTAEIFGHLPGYQFYANNMPQQEGGDEEHNLTRDVPSPRKKRLKPSLPPKGKMQCLWRDGCTVNKAFDYSAGTIKDWKTHINSHLEGSVGVVKCRWGGCKEEAQKDYMFKHIVTHEVRFKLLCPRGCGVAVRDDNRERHLKVCQFDE